MDEYEKKIYNSDAKLSGVKDRETKVSEEGCVSTHTEYFNKRVDCLIQVPACRIRSRAKLSNGAEEIKEEVWPLINGVYTPIMRKKKKEEILDG